MPSPDIDPIVLGHNPFFGVDHLSRERGAQRGQQFEQTSAILDMIRFAGDSDVNAMMMSTHPRASVVAEAIRNEPDLRGSLSLYILLPNISKYIRQSNEKGIINVVLDQLKGAGLGQKFALLARGGISVLRKDVNEILRTLIRLELMPFRGLKLRAVFLHDVLTDLALALDLKSVLELYVREVSGRHNAAPGFATKNLPMLVEKFKRFGFEGPLVLTHFNKVGFWMNPSREACERCLAENDLTVMAMGTLASGYLRPDEAYDYLYRLGGIDSVVVGVSSPGHAEETFSAIRRHAGRS